MDLLTGEQYERKSELYHIAVARYLDKTAKTIFNIYDWLDDDEQVEYFNLLDERIRNSYQRRNKK